MSVPSLMLGLCELGGGSSFPRIRRIKMIRPFSSDSPASFLVVGWFLPVDGEIGFLSLVVDCFPFLEEGLKVLVLPLSYGVGSALPLHRSVVTQSGSSSHLAMKKSSPRMNIYRSRVLHPKAHGQLLAQSRPMSAPTFCTRCCQPAHAGDIPYTHFFKRQQQRSVPTK